jgi:ankyrin repeat protein
MNIRDLVFSANLEALNKMLNADPKLANSEFSLPDNPATEHPLHRICDGVFSGQYSESIALEMAKMFLKYGADVNVDRMDGHDSPLTAASSLHCDQLALLYIQNGARINHRGCHGGTALHWASWCGRDALVRELVVLAPDINQLCIDFKSTPLFWAIHGHRFGGKDNQYHQVNCARILLEHGADPAIPNFEGYLPKQLLDGDDKELLDLF